MKAKIYTNLVGINNGDKERLILFTDVQCGYCGKNQAYAHYNENGCCRGCGKEEYVPILFINNYPFILPNNNEEAIIDIKEKLDSFLTMANLVSYDKISYSNVISKEHYIVAIKLKSSTLNKTVVIEFIANNFGEFEESTLRYKNKIGSQTVSNLNILNTLDRAARSL